MNAQQLSDRQEIVDLTIAYCWALDTRDWEALGEMFLPDATAMLLTPSELVGIDAIRERISFALDPLDESQHLVANHQVVVDGDTATCRCYLQAQHVRQAAATTGSPNFIVAGRYEDRLVRTAAGWRVAHREIVAMWTEGNPDVVRSG